MYSVYLPMELDTGTKAYILAVYTDLYPCIIFPMSIIFGSTTVSRKFSENLKKYCIPCYGMFMMKEDNH